MARKKSAKQQRPSAAAAGAEQQPRPREKWAWPAAAVLVAALHLTAVSREFGGGFGGDSVVYFLLGRALALGQGYVDLYLPGHPPQVQYPFLFPLLLAPFHLVFREPLAAMHVLVALANTGAAALLGLWAQRTIPAPGRGPVFTVLFGTVPAAYLLSGDLLSEPVYMFWCYLALALLPRRKQAELSAAKFAALAGALLAAYFTRTAGLALIGAALPALWLGKTRVKIGPRLVPALWPCAAILAAAAAAWWARDLLAGGGGAYVSQLFRDTSPDLGPGVTSAPALADRFRGNVAYYLPVLGLSGFGFVEIIPIAHAGVRVLGYALNGLIAAGLAGRFRRGLVAGELFFIWSLAIILVWPFRERRFLVPLLPLACFYMLEGIRFGMELTKRVRAPGRAALVAAAAVILVHGFYLMTLVRDRMADGREPRAPMLVEGYGWWRDPVINWAKYDVRYRRADAREREFISALTDYLALNRVAGEVTPPGSVLMGRKPMITYILSGRECAPMIFDADPARQWDHLEQNRVDYIVLGLGEDRIMPLWESHPERLEAVARAPGSDAMLLRVVRPGAEGAPGH